MKVKSTTGALSLAAAVAMVLASPLYAHMTQSEGYVVDGSGKVVMDGSKSCVQAGNWSKDLWTTECGKPAPAPEPAPAPPPPPPPAPEPAPAPPPPPPAPEPVAAPPMVERMTLDGTALFALDSANLTAEGRAAVDNVVQDLHGFDKVRSITITGHTDSTGSEAYNQKLSERRANAIRDYLVSQGVNPALLSTVGMGEMAPIADNSSAEGRQQNRRVEVDVDGSRLVSQ